MRKRIILALLLLSALPVFAQTSITLNSATTYSAPKIGSNLCQNDYFGCIISKNLTFINPGFEGQTNGVTVNVASGSSTSFTGQNGCDQVPPNFFTGGTYYVAFSATGGVTGSSGTISANTGPNNGGGGCNGGPSYTISALPGSLVNGDVVYVYQNNSPACTFSAMGWQCSNSGSSTVAVDTTGGDQFAGTLGTQNIKFTLANSTDTPTINTGFDTDASSSPNYYFNGTYTWCVKTKLGTGSGITITLHGGRTAGSTLSFSQALTPTTSVQTQCATFTATESASNPPTAGASVQMYITASGGAGTVWVDDSILTANNDIALKFWRNQIATDLVTIMDAGSIRDWNGQNGSNFINETMPAFGRKGAFSQIGGNYATWQNIQFGLGELLTEAAEMGIKKVSYVLPLTTKPSDVANYVDFISAPCSKNTTGTIQRCTYWQTAPFTSEFNNIDLSDGNEVWNGGASGQNITFGPYPAWNYLPIVNSICTAAKADADWNASIMKCSATIQVGQTFSGGYQSQLNQAKVDYQDMNLYGSGMSITDPNNPDQWVSAWTDYWVGANDCTNSGQSFCLSFATYAPGTIVYEYNNNTTNGYSGTQAQLNGYSNGFGYGIVDTSAAAWMQWGNGQAKFGPVPQYNFFTLFQRAFGVSGLTNFIWGGFTGPGGKNNNPRPPMQAMGMFNRCIGSAETAIGTTVSGSPTYVFSGYNGVKGESAVPYVQAFTYTNGSNYCIDLRNLSSSSQAVTIGGTNPPSGTCTVTKYSSPNLNDNNESSMVVNLVTTTPACSTSQTIPAYTEETISYSAGGCAPTLTGITISGGSTVQVGNTLSFTGTCSYTGCFTGTTTCSQTADIYGTLASWNSSVPSSATITTPAGVLTGVAAGSTNVTGAAGSFTSTPHAVTVTAAPPTLTGVTVAGTGGATVVNVGATLQMLSSCHYSDSTITSCNSVDVHGNQCGSWTSSSAHATISGTGLVTGVSAGSSNVGCSVGAFTSPPVAITVTASSMYNMSGTAKVSGSVVNQ